MIDVGTKWIKMKRVPPKKFDLSLVFLAHYCGQMDGHDQTRRLIECGLCVVTDELFDLFQMEVG